MPSTVNPGTILTGPGKIHVDVVNAAADLFTTNSSAASADVGAILAQALAAPSVVSYTAGGGGDANRAISSADGPFYVGDSPSDALIDLFRVVNAADDTAIFDKISNTYIEVSSISPASVGDGFFSGNLTVTFSATIPSGTQYKIYYGKRTTLGAIPRKLASFPMIRRSQERVRFPEFVRSGLAPTSIANPLDIVTNDYLDPYMAQWKAVVRGSPGTLVNTNSGSNGFVYVGRKKNLDDVNDGGLTGHQASAFLAVYEKVISSNVIALSTVWTKIDPALTGSTNVGGSGDLIELNGSDYFRLTGPHRTAVKLGVDMLEVTFSSGLKETYIIRELDSSNVRRARLITLGGASADLPTATVNFKWIRPAFHVGGDNDFSTSPTENHFKSLGHYVAGAITGAPFSEVAQAVPFFASGTISRDRADSSRNNWNLKAFSWGGFTEEGSSVSDLGKKRVNGELWGDGSVHSYDGVICGYLSHRPGAIPSGVINSNQSYTFNPRIQSYFNFEFTGSSQVELTLAYEPLAGLEDGQRITIFIHYNVTASSEGENSFVTWGGGQFVFSGNDAHTPSVAGTVLKFDGVYRGSSFYMTRTDYGP